MTATRRAAAATAAALLVPALAGCSAPASGPLADVSVRVVQYRSDIAPHRVQLEVVNDSADDVVVRSAALVGAGWSPAPSWTDEDDPATVRAGTTVDLPAALATASCGRRGPLGARLRLADGTIRTVRAVDLHGTLAALHAGDCFAETAARTATVRFTALVPHGRTAEAVLEVRAGPDAARGVVVEQVLPTPLLSPPSGDERWDVGRRFTADGVLRLPVVPTRCDLHAIAEDKVGSVLPVRLRLADGRSGTVRAVAPARLKDAVLAWVVRACGNA